MQDSKRRVMRLRTIDSQGRSVDPTAFEYRPTDPETGKPYDDVVIFVRPISREQHRELRKSATTIEHLRGVGPVERIDPEQVQDACLCWAITGWSGIIGADNQALPPVDAAKIALPFPIRMEIVTQALGAESVEVDRASFREPA